MNQRIALLKPDMNMYASNIDPVQQEEDWN